MVNRLIALIIGYLLGGIQTAILYGKKKGVDITKYGSGNPGATNTFRVMGKKSAFLVFIGDSLKAVIAILLSNLLFEMNPLVIGLYAGIGAIIGHSYPLYFHFKGGKGIATTAGILLILDWRIFLIAAALFICVFSFTKIVSVSSLILTASIPIQFYFFYKNEPHINEIICLGIVITLITFYRHRENIKRLIKGTEAPLTTKK